MQTGLGIKIKEIRVKLNLTQYELADAIGIHQSFISKIERYNISFSLEKLKRLNKFCKEKKIKFNLNEFFS